MARGGLGTHPYRVRRLAVVMALLAGALVVPQGAAAGAEGSCAVRDPVTLPARMRDGTVLRADVYRPEPPGEYPVILMRLPYDKGGAQTVSGSYRFYRSPEFFASHCYIVVIQDTRGQYASDGRFYPFRDEMHDGYDTVEWAADLPGSTGKVGMYGFSYVGATQWLAATQAPPHLTTIVPMHTASNYYDGWTYQDGAFSQAFIQSWPMLTIAQSAMDQQGRPVIVDRLQDDSKQLPSWYEWLPLDEFPPYEPQAGPVAPYFHDWLEHPTNDAYWRRWSIRQRWDDIEVPVLSLAGWYDVFLNGGFDNFTGMRAHGGSAVARDNQRIVVGPWNHVNWGRSGELGQIDFGPAGNSHVDSQQLRWFDHWLKGSDNGVQEAPAVSVFVMGANRWRHADDWPIPGTEFTRYYLHSEAGANSVAGDGWLSTTPPNATERAADTYRYDPSDPVPSVGGHGCCDPTIAPMGPYDQRPVERRDDVLVYDTPVLREPTEVTGPIEVTLWASSSAPDTDFTAKLADVHPDGQAINLNDGIRRARYRLSETDTQLIEPGRAYEYTIEVWPTSNLFKPGHRIRLEISSSNFPMYDRNPNTGDEFGSNTRMRAADQRILHDPQHPSYVRLPIMPQPVAG